MRRWAVSGASETANWRYASQVWKLTIAKPRESAICSANPMPSMGVEQRFAARIARGAAMGNKYRAEPAKNTISAPAKKISTQASRKFFLKHEDKTTTPNPRDAQNIGFGS